MAVHAAAVNPEDRLGHERGEQPVLDGDALDGVLEGHGVIRRVQGVGVVEVDLVLADGDFMMLHLHIDLQRLQGGNDVGADPLRFVIWGEVEVAADIVGQGVVQIAVLAEQEEFQFRPDVVDIAQRLRPGDLALESVARIAFERLTIRAVDIADDPGPQRQIVAGPGQGTVGAHIRPQEHVRFLDAGEPLDGGTVEPHPPAQRIFQPVRGDRHAFGGAHDVRELEIDEPDVFVLHILENGLVVHGSSCSRRRMEMPAQVVKWGIGRPYLNGCTFLTLAPNHSRSQRVS